MTNWLCRSGREATLGTMTLTPRPGQGGALGLYSLQGCKVRQLLYKCLYLSSLIDDPSLNCYTLMTYWSCRAGREATLGTMTLTPRPGLGGALGLYSLQICNFNNSLYHSSLIDDPSVNCYTLMTYWLYRPLNLGQGQRSWQLMKAHMYFPICLYDHHKSSLCLLWIFKYLL